MSKTSTATGTRERPQGSPMVLVLMVVVVVPAFALGTAFGAGPTAIVGALVSMFCLIAFLGGPLRTDLRIAAVMMPFIFIATVVPRLLAELSQPAASGRTVPSGLR